MPFLRPDMAKLRVRPAPFWSPSQQPGEGGRGHQPLLWPASGRTPVSMPPTPAHATPHGGRAFQISRREALRPGPGQGRQPVGRGGWARRAAGRDGGGGWGEAGMAGGGARREAGGGGGVYPSAEPGWAWDRGPGPGPGAQPSRAAPACHSLGCPPCIPSCFSGLLPWLIHMRVFAGPCCGVRALHPYSVAATFCLICSINLPGHVLAAPASACVAGKV